MRKIGQVTFKAKRSVCVIAAIAWLSVGCDSSTPPVGDAKVAADAAQQDGSGNDGSGGDGCPSAPTASKEVCSSVGQICSYSDGCCACGVILGCGDDPIWACADGNSSSCPQGPPQNDSVCDLAAGSMCGYCDGGELQNFNCDGAKWKNLGSFSCAGAP